MFTCQYGNGGHNNTTEQLTLVLRQDLLDHLVKAQIIDKQWIDINVVPDWADMPP